MGHGTGSQRVQDLDLNYEFTAKVTNSPSVSQGGSTASPTLAGAPVSLVNNMQEAPPLFDSFAWLAIALAPLLFLVARSIIQEARRSLEKLLKCSSLTKQNSPVTYYIELLF